MSYATRRYHRSLRRIDWFLVAVVVVIVCVVAYVGWAVGQVPMFEH